jgi:MarR-like DNA-binding transcriptional regulator SgrR of sgrS sRNA
MPRILIILLICCAYVGCAAPRTTGPELESRPADGEAIRILFGSGLSREEAVGLGGGSGVDVELVEDGGNPALMLQLGEADLGLLIGKQVGALENGASAGYELERLQGWDRTYFLRLDPTKRWVNDPAFRRWLATIIDREEMLGQLFEGRGEPAFSLTPGRADQPSWEQPSGRPFSASSEPRLDLRYDDADPWAEIIAARLKAVLEVERVRLSISPVDRIALHVQPSGGALSMALLLYRQQQPDAVTDLQEILEPLGEEAAAELDLLDRAARHSDDGVRSEMAWWAESSMLRDARIVPLVRLHCWLARRSP